MLVELRVEAREDLADGAWFYERQSRGPGDYFIECIADDLKTLESIYGIHELVFGFHRKLARRFPFAIYYVVTDSCVEVVAILDCRRDPVSITARIKQTKR